MSLIRGTHQADIIMPGMVSPGVQGGPPTPEMDDIQAGDGADTVRAGSGDDRMFGENGDDQLWGEAGLDWLNGGNGNDWLHGGSECDQLVGGRGDDRLWGDGGNDQLRGGPGLDEAVYAGAPSDYAVAMVADGMVTVRDLNGGGDGLDEGIDTLHAVERLRFTGSLSLGSTQLVSTSNSGEQGNSHSYNPSLSADGVRLAFGSLASNLVPNDTNVTVDIGGNDIFLRDLSTDKTVLASTSSSGLQGNAASGETILSADGNKLAFASYASNLVPGDSAGTYDVFVKDLTTGTVQRANTSAAGEAGNNDNTNYNLSFSSDASKLAFDSASSNLVLGDTNSNYDVFVKDLHGGSIVLASTSANGEQGNDFSALPSLSADGTKLAFASAATNFASDDTNGTLDIFVKDLRSGSIVLVSTSASGEQGNGYSADPSISADGRYIAFTSEASNLVFGDTNEAYDIFVKDLVSGMIVRASTSAAGEQSIGGFGSFEPALSADGHRLAFISDAGNLVAGTDTNLTSDVYVKDLESGAIVRASGLGNVPGDSFSTQASLTADGSRIAFTSYSSNLVSNDTNNSGDIFVRDIIGTGETVFTIEPDGTLKPIDTTGDTWGC